MDSGRETVSCFTTSGQEQQKPDQQRYGDSDREGRHVGLHKVA